MSLVYFETCRCRPALVCQPTASPFTKACLPATHPTSLPPPKTFSTSQPFAPYRPYPPYSPFLTTQPQPANLPTYLPNHPTYHLPTCLPTNNPNESCPFACLSSCPYLLTSLSLCRPVPGACLPTYSLHAACLPVDPTRSVIVACSCRYQPAVAFLPTCLSAYRPQPSCLPTSHPATLPVVTCR